MSIALEHIASPEATNWGDLLPEQVRMREIMATQSEQIALLRLRVLTNEEYGTLIALVRQQAKDQAIDGFRRPGEPPKHPSQRGQYHGTETEHSSGRQTWLLDEERHVAKLNQLGVFGNIMGDAESTVETAAAVYLREWMKANCSDADRELARMYYHERLTQSEIAAQIEEGGTPISQQAVAQRIKRLHGRIIDSGILSLLRMRRDALVRLLAPADLLAMRRLEIDQHYASKLGIENDLVPSDAQCFFHKSHGRGDCRGPVRRSVRMLGNEPSYYCKRHGQPSRLIEEWDPVKGKMREAMLDYMNSRGTSRSRSSDSESAMVAGGATLGTIGNVNGKGRHA